MIPAAPTFEIATAADLEALLPSVREFYAHFGFAWDEVAKTAVLREILSHPHAGQLWLARLGMEIVGYALVVFYWSLELGGRTAILDEFHVGSLHRGRGIGGQFLEVLAQAIPAEGIRNLRLELDDHHAGAAGLYARHAFRRDGRELWTRRLTAT